MFVLISTLDSVNWLNLPKNSRHADPGIWTDNRKFVCFFCRMLMTVCWLTRR